jgi:hypothetical protein
MTALDVRDPGPIQNPSLANLVNGLMMDVYGLDQQRMDTDR